MSWSTTTSTSSTSTYWDLDNRHGAVYRNLKTYRYDNPKIRRSNQERPLRQLVEAENELRSENPQPSEAMPKKELIFNPEELVLGGETGWKRFQPKKQ